MEKILLIFTLILMFTFLFFLGIKMDGSVHGPTKNELSDMKYKSSHIFHVPQNTSSRSKLNDTMKNRITNDNVSKESKAPFIISITNDITKNVTERTPVTHFTANNNFNEVTYETKNPVTVKNAKPKYKYENVSLLLYNKQVEERNSNKNNTIFSTNGLPILPHINRRSQSRNQKNETSTIKPYQKNMTRNKQDYNTRERKRARDSAMMANPEKNKDTMSDWRYKQVEGRPGFYR